MVHVSKACVSKGLISTLYINILVFSEVKWDHGPCFGSTCKYRSNKYFTHPYFSAKNGIYRCLYSEGIPCAYLKLQVITFQKRIQMTVNLNK